MESNEVLVRKLKKANDELVAALEALKASEARQAGIVASAMDAIITMDGRGQITVFNAAAEMMFGYAAGDMMGRRLDILIPERFREKHAHHVQRFGQTNVTHRAMGALGAITGLRANGEEFPIEASISQMNAGEEKLFTVIMRDITEKKKIEAQVLRTQRMESIGSLASGIAHDLNNILSPILLSIGLLKSRANDDSTGKILDTIETSAKRGAEIVQQVLSFARGMDGQRIVVHPQALVKDIEKFIRDAFPKNIALSISIPPEVNTVLGDPTQLHQLLLNLCVNARDAMPQGGTLRIRAANTQVDQHYAAMNSGSKVGSYVVFSVTDTGVGIPEGIIDKIFDPFFTTKEFGKGTGLGLSTVAAVVKSHGGFLNVYSESGIETTFRIYLPATQSTVADDAALKPEGLPRGKGETILVIDDEQPILNITSQTLQMYGYHVLTALDGAEAVALYALNRKDIAAVITDMMMPVMDGPATIHALRRINLDIRIIAASGLDADRRSPSLPGVEIMHYLKKPYSAEALLTALQRVLA